MAEYTPSETEVRDDYVDRAVGQGVGAFWEARSEEAAAEFDRFLARARRDAWDACYRQMVTAPARGVTVMRHNNPY